MRIGLGLATLTLCLAAGCTPTTTTSDGSPPLSDVPEGVLLAAAPFQDLTAIQLREDGCYWYRHIGPVETTLLPLLTREGRPICARAPDAAAPAGT